MALPGLRKLHPHEMGTGGVARTLLILAIPSALSGLLGTTYEMVDRLFISWLGPSQVSGIGLGLPVLFFVHALGATVGIGVSALVSRRLGQRDADGARRVLDQALLIAFCVGGLLSLAGPLAARNILQALADPETSRQMLTYGSLYLSRIMLGAVLIHLGVVGEAGLRAQGNTVTGMRIMVVGNLANLALDGFFIFGPTNLPAKMPALWGLGGHLSTLFTRYGLDLGVQGGASVTVLTRLLTVSLLMAGLGSRRSHVRPSNPLRSWPRFHFRTLLEIYRFGLPMAVALLSMSMSAGAVNRILTRHQETAVGVLAIASSLEMFAFVPIFSLGGAVVPMVGYNLGAGSIRRCRRIVLTSCAVAGTAMGLLGAMLWAFPGVFLGFFTDDEAMLRMGTSYLRINSWSYFLIGCDIMLSSGFQGLGRPALSMLVQIIRTLIVKVPAALVLSAFFGVTGVWWSSPVSTMACFTVASAVMWRLLNRLERLSPQARPFGGPPIPQVEPDTETVEM